MVQSRPSLPSEKHHTPCDEFEAGKKHRTSCDVLKDMSRAVEKTGEIAGFSPLLSWSHYRALTKVENKNKQLFASKYMLYLPSEDELARELKREQKSITMEMGKKKNFTDKANE